MNSVCTFLNLVIRWVALLTSEIHGGTHAGIGYTVTVLLIVVDVF